MAHNNTMFAQLLKLSSWCQDMGEEAGNRQATGHHVRPDHQVHECAGPQAVPAPAEAGRLPPPPAALGGPCSIGLSRRLPTQRISSLSGLQPQAVEVVEGVELRMRKANPVLGRGVRRRQSLDFDLRTLNPQGWG